jgi:hypothetical protein
VDPGGADPTVLLDGLRTHWQASLKLDGIEVALKPRFDPYQVATRLLSNTQALEQR